MHCHSYSCMFKVLLGSSYSFMYNLDITLFKNKCTVQLPSGVSIVTMKTLFYLLYGNHGLFYYQQTQGCLIIINGNSLSKDLPHLDNHTRQYTYITVFSVNDFDFYPMVHGRQWPDFFVISLHLQYSSFFRNVNSF